MPRTFFTSDTHFGHANIIRYCNRPYLSVSEMNADLTRRWNAAVGPDDTVYCLGDFAMGERRDWPDFVAGLNGRRCLVRGNHDGSAATMLAIGFDEVHDNVVVDVDGFKLWLNHFPPETNGIDFRDDRGFVRPTAPAPYDIALCGHVHDKWTISEGAVNVGVDRWSFRPIELDAIRGAVSLSPD